MAVHVPLWCSGGGPKVASSPSIFMTTCTVHPWSLSSCPLSNAYGGSCTTSGGSGVLTYPLAVGVALTVVVAVVVPAAGVHSPINVGLVRALHEVRILSSRNALVLSIYASTNLLKPSFTPTFALNPSTVFALTVLPL